MGHIAADPNCPARGAAAWDASKFRSPSADEEYTMAMDAELDYEVRAYGVQ